MIGSRGDVAVQEVVEAKWFSDGSIGRLWPVTATEAAHTPTADVRVTLRRAPQTSGRFHGVLPWGAASALSGGRPPRARDPQQQQAEHHEDRSPEKD